jgi:hypothetical protein
MSAPDPQMLADLSRAYAANTYKLGAMAAMLGLTGQESCEVLCDAVRKLKVAATPPAPPPVSTEPQWPFYK